LSRVISQLFMESSSLRHIIGGLYLTEAPEVYVAVLNLYLDDSGTGPSQNLAVAAGWIAKMPTWDFFARDWEKIGKIESNKFDCMHMTDFVGGWKDFKNWGGLPKKVQLATKLREIIKKRALKGFALGVAKDDFDAIVPAGLKVQGFENHYTFAIRRVLGMIDEWRQEQGLEDKTIEYFFDWMDKHDPRRQEIEGVFDRAKGSPEAFEKYGIDGAGDSVHFRDRCKVLPLQAADMLAWSVYCVTVGEFSGKPPHQIARETFTDFYGHRARKFLEGGYMNRTHLAAWVKLKGF
jgi:uncharacterized protein DUF3800